MIDRKMRLSKDEKQDLDKFTKFLALKATEVIVQSRLGEKVSTPCKPQSKGADWFNLNTNDVPEVVIEAKKILNTELVISRKFLFCIEISLRTAEGDHMVLESWCIRLLPEQCETSTTSKQLIYNRMGILLKSLVSVTRVTPAYKVSRRQGPDSYVICYRMFMEEPSLHCLGEGAKEIRIGQICSPIGTLQLSCNYRTKMTISPTQSSRDNSLLLKSDHFNNMSPKNRRYSTGDDKTSSLSETMKIGAFADITKKKPQFKEQAEVDLPPFLTFFADKISLNDHNPDDDTISLENERLNLENDRLSGKSISEEDNLTPSQAAIQERLQGGNDAVSEPERNGNAAMGHLPGQSDGLTMRSTTEDFIMVELKTPFAKATGEKFELGKFFREWQHAPSLETFKEVPSVEGQDLKKQLETFESDLNEFDSIVQTLCQGSPNNN